MFEYQLVKKYEALEKLKEECQYFCESHDIIKLEMDRYQEKFFHWPPYPADKAHQDEWVDRILLNPAYKNALTKQELHDMRLDETEEVALTFTRGVKFLYQKAKDLYEAEKEKIENKRRQDRDAHEKLNQEAKENEEERVRKEKEKIPDLKLAYNLLLEFSGIILREIDPGFFADQGLIPYQI